jgi:hypothetical protein
MIIMNYLAVSLPLGGLSTKELSDRLYNLFTPAGITFSIWGIIYLLLGIYVFYALFASNSAVHKNPYIDRIALPFLISCLLNGSWIVAWHYRTVLLSMFIMVALLLTLIFIYRTVPITYKKKINFKEAVVFIPFSVYLGWISVATVANASALLVSYGVSGGSYAGIIASVMIVVASALAFISIAKDRDIFYSAVIAWALYGIYVARNADAAKAISSASFVASISLIMSIAVLVLVIITAAGLVSRKWSKD